MAKTDQKFNNFSKIKFFIFLILFFCLRPGIAHAQLGQLLASIGAFIITTATTILSVTIIVVLILQLFLGVMGLINTGLANLVSWSISPGAVPWSYTDPARNPFIQAGLEITGGFVSMGLILALVAIALATILRLEGWDTKRLLFRLIVAALLVYFAPVICGLIVDATNIFMWYFADRIGGIGVLTSTFLNVASNIISAFLGIPILQQIITVAASIIQLIFQLYLALVLLSFFLLFLFRHAAIWIAVILSPIAFICWILPVTKRYWDWWWKNFIQWALAGPIAAFFLYLGATAAQEVARAQWTLGNIFAGFGGLAGELRQIVPHLFPIGLLNLGIILGIQGAGVGADLVLKWSQRGMGYLRAAPGWAVRTRMGQRALGLVGRFSGWAARKAQEQQPRAQQVRVIGWATGVIAGLSRGAHSRLLRYAVRGRQARIPPEFAQMTPQEQESYVNNTLASAEERIQFAAEMKKLGALQKTSKEFRERIVREAKALAESPYFKKEVGAIFATLPDKMTKEIKIALAVTPEKSPEKAREEIESKIKPIADELELETKINPQIEQEIQKQMKETGKSRKETIEDIATASLHVSEMRPGDIPDVAGSATNSLAFRWGMRTATPAEMQKVFETFDRETAEKVLEGPGGLNQLFENLSKNREQQKELLIKLHRENESLLRWFCLTPAGRAIKFIGRDVLEKEYGDYDNFLKEMRKMTLPEAPPFPEKPKIIVPPERVPPRIVRRYGRLEVEGISEEERRRPFGRREGEGRPGEEKGPPGRKE